VTRASRTVVAADDRTLAAVLAPRREMVTEVPSAGHRGWDPAAGPAVYRFTLGDGPVRSYQRTVTVERRPAGGWAVAQQVDFSVGLPWFSWLFVLPLRRTLGRLEDRTPWWAPPAGLDRRGAVALATLCMLTVVVGYLDTVMAQTMTYVGAEYGVGTAGQGVAMAATQVSAVLAIAALAAADRSGRRRLLLSAMAGGAVLTAVAGAGPGVGWVAATEVPASALVGACYLLVFVVAAEEMPAGSRAWAAGVLALCYGLGSGAVLLALPLAGLGPGGWRWVYVLGIAGLPGVVSGARHLPESRRFAAGHPPPASSSPAGRFSWSGLSAEHRRRLWVLGLASLAYAAFATPAGQFTNQFLRVERHFSPAGISILQQVSGTVGGLGVLVGGRLADTWGRRPVAACGVAAGTAVTVAAFFSHGWGLWAWTVAGSLLAYAVAPALAVYGPELFPTRSRGAATGVITALGAAGGVAGLVATGLLSSALGAIGPALTVMAAGPLLMVVLIIAAFPETARRPLEELNFESAGAWSRQAAGGQQAGGQLGDPDPAAASGAAQPVERGGGVDPLPGHQVSDGPLHHHPAVQGALQLPGQLVAAAGGQTGDQQAPEDLGVGRQAIDLVPGPVMAAVDEQVEHADRGTHQGHGHA
jgi:MFS family permease